MLIFALLFWGSIGLILFTYAGFPLILALRAAVVSRRKGVRPQIPAAITDDSLPRISILIAVHNEADCIIHKLENLRSLRYPHSEIEIIVASDGSTDQTNDLVSGYSDPRVRLLILPRQGKNATLNAAASISRGEILVFTDADTLMKEDALLHLVLPFKDSSIGGVGGDYRYLSQNTHSNEEKTYWKYDRFLKYLQSSAKNMTSATGQIYAIRRSLFRPIPQKLVDDFYTSVQVPASHLRLLFEPRAIAYGPMAKAGKPEFDRKVRVVTGGLRTVWTVRQLLNPIRYGFYAFQLLTHKLLRRVVIIPLVLIAVSSIALWQQGWFYQLALCGQILLHGLAFAGYLLRERAAGRMKVFSLPFFFDLVNLACLVAFFNLLRGVRHDIWNPARSGAPVCTVLETNR
jgi:cellulose synthase/poly-beta-1,6-N-acetylglucosamine synthase-like glycosyltransferase